LPVARQYASLLGKNQNGDFSFDISRVEFENAARSIADTAVSVAYEAIAAYASEHSSHTIDEVILVGGSSRVPLVRDCLRKMLVEKLQLTQFSSQEFCCSLDPEQAVAQGLAIRGAVLMGHDIPQLKDVLMLDMLSSSIGLISWADINRIGQGRDANAKPSTVLERVRNSGLHAVIVGSSDKDANKKGTRQDDHPHLRIQQWDPSSESVPVQGQHIRYFDPILYRCERIPCSAAKSFRIEDPRQKFVSLDIFEEIEAEPDIHISTHDTSTNKQYSYQLIGTYDLPIPKRSRKSMPANDATIEKASSTSVVSRCVGAVNDYFGIEPNEDDDCDGSFMISVEMSMGVDGAIGFSVTRQDKDDETSEGKLRTRKDDYSVVLLMALLVVVLGFYLFVRVMFADFKYADTVKEL
jgi:uncharacterized membrane protein